MTSCITITAIIVRTMLLHYTFFPKSRSTGLAAMVKESLKEGDSTNYDQLNFLIKINYQQNWYISYTNIIITKEKKWYVIKNHQIISPLTNN